MHDGARPPFARFLLRALLAASLLGGCASNGDAASTHVARRELYRVDNVKYDEFFEDVFELQKQAVKAPDEEKKAREPLSAALGAGETSGEALAALVGERAKKMVLGKPKMVLGVEGLEPNGAPILGKAIALSPPLAKRKPWPKEAKEFTDALEQTLRAEAKVVDKYGPLADKAKRRLELVDKLRDSIAENLPSAKPETRSELERELGASRAVLTKAAEECTSASARGAKFLRLSAEAITLASEAKPEPRKPTKGAR